MIMRFASFVTSGLKAILLLSVCLVQNASRAQSNVTVRVMAANLNGNTQSYQPFALRIFQGLKPDVVAIQEFNYGNNAASDFRSMLDTAFGTNFVYYREPFNGSGDIPNGIISRWPILNSGSWADSAAIAAEPRLCLGANPVARNQFALRRQRAFAHQFSHGPVRRGHGTQKFDPVQLSNERVDRSRG